MTNVVWLQGHQAPPDDPAWALVAQDHEGVHQGADMVSHGHGVTFYIPYPPTEVQRSEAIARAYAWAARNAAPTIYVDAR